MAVGRHFAHAVPPAPRRHRHGPASRPCRPERAFPGAAGVVRVRGVPQRRPGGSQAAHRGDRHAHVCGHGPHVCLRLGGQCACRRVRRHRDRSRQGGLYRPMGRSARTGALPKRASVHLRGLCDHVRAVPSRGRAHAAARAHRACRAAAAFGRRAAGAPRRPRRLQRVEDDPHVRSSRAPVRGHWHLRRPHLADEHAVRNEGQRCGKASSLWWRAWPFRWPSPSERGRDARNAISRSCSGCSLPSSSSPSCWCWCWKAESSSTRRLPSGSAGASSASSHGRCGATSPGAPVCRPPASSRWGSWPSRAVPTWKTWRTPTCCPASPCRCPSWHRSSWWWR